MNRLLLLVAFLPVAAACADDVFLQATEPPPAFDAGGIVDAAHHDANLGASKDAGGPDTSDPPDVLTPGCYVGGQLYTCPVAEIVDEAGTVDPGEYYICPSVWTSDGGVTGCKESDPCQSFDRVCGNQGWANPTCNVLIWDDGGFGGNGFWRPTLGTCVPGPDF